MKKSWFCKTNNTLALLVGNVNNTHITTTLGRVSMLRETICYPPPTHCVTSSVLGSITKLEYEKWVLILMTSIGYHNMNICCKVN